MGIDRGSQCALTLQSIPIPKTERKKIMAKPVIKFSAVPYEIGGKKGLRL